MLDSSIIPILCHIPKTGGTTVDNLLRSQSGAFFKLDNIYNILEFKASIDDTGIHPNTHIIGHSAFGIHEYLEKKGKKHIYYTLLREPLSRMKSHYFYNLRLKFIPADTTFADFARQHNNTYMKFFHSATPQAAFNILKNDFTFFGLMEKMDEFMALMVENIGLEPVPVKNRNKNHIKFNLDEDQINEAIDIIGKDILFYQMAKEYYETKFSGKTACKVDISDDKDSFLTIVTEAAAEPVEPSADKDTQDKKELPYDDTLAMLGMVRELEAKGELEEAEKLTRDINRITGNPFHLINFYTRTANTNKLIALLLDECEKFAELFESKPYFSVNKYFIPKFKFIAETLVDTPATEETEKLMARMIALTPAISNLTKHVNLSYIISFSNETENALNNTKDAVIIGCGQASKIATAYAVKYGIKVAGYIDDNRTGQFNGVDICKRDTVPSSVNTVLKGPCQRGNFDDLTEKGYKIIELVNYENPDN